jgi:translocation and assembly module TamA
LKIKGKISLELSFMITKFHFILILFLLLTNTIAYAESDYAYRVEFTGLKDEEAQSLLMRESELVRLIDSPPSTAATLQHRVDDDIVILLKALQSLAYYNASIKPYIDKTTSPITIRLEVNTGPIYFFSAFNIIPPCEGIALDDLGIEIGSVAYPAAIIEAEESLIALLEKRGYPLAKISQREVIADVANRMISVNLILNTGPQAFFGETDICGNKDLLPIFFCRKIVWQEGCLYDPRLVQRTFNNLELSGLFSSINITHDEETLEDGSLPMHITVTDAKRRSVGFGAGYATDLGFGLTADWQHRNISGRGDRLTFTANVWQIRQDGSVRYTLPDFLQPRQDLIWTLELEHEDVRAFREISFSLSGIIERQLNDRLRVSGGGMYTRLRNTHSNNNRTFTLIKAPLQLFWNGADRMMDPTKGLTVHVKVTPTMQTESPCFFYTYNWLNLTAYKPLDCNERVILAGRACFGSIWGATKHSIPPSERFYAGSDNLLRGYHYLTVSPLNEDKKKPIGGRSLMLFSLEARMRIKDPFGLVFFYDIGNVYSSSFPRIGHKQRQSAGVGVRYHTPVGPIRLDVAVPFNPRKHLDKGFQVYFSIGQSF